MPAAIAATTSSTMMAVVAVTSPRSSDVESSSCARKASAARHHAVRIWIWYWSMSVPFGFWPVRSDGWLVVAGRYVTIEGAITGHVVESAASAG